MLNETRKRERYRIMFYNYYTEKIMIDRMLAQNEIPRTDSPDNELMAQKVK
jgi:hypothetical protein